MNTIENVVGKGDSYYCRIILAWIFLENIVGKGDSHNCRIVDCSACLDNLITCYYRTKLLLGSIGWHT